MPYRYLPYLGFVFLPLLTGCAQQRIDSTWVQVRSAGSDTGVPYPAMSLSGDAFASSKLEEPTGKLTLQRALSLALKHNPDLLALSWEVRARRARARQAGFLPNPEAELEVDEFGGSGKRKGFDAAEVSFQLSQRLEMGGKRGKRVRSAALEEALSIWDYESRRLDVFTETRKAFVEVLATQERLELAKDSLRLADRVFEVVSERVQAGKGTPLEETKAKVAVATTRIALARIKRELGAARKRLAAIWGSDQAVFIRVEGTFYAIGDIPDFKSHVQLIPRNPDMARWGTELELRQTTLSLEQARRISDLTVRAGVTRFQETDDEAFMLGLAVPLPLFDRNQGGILEARHNLSKAVEERRAVAVDLDAAIDQVHQGLSSAYLEAVNLRDDVLLGARFVFDTAREGFRQGKLGFLDVLDAQRTLFEVQGRYIGALTEYHKSIADLERLAGLQPMEADTSERIEMGGGR